MRRFDQEWELLVSARTWLVDHGFRLLGSRGPEGMSQGFDIDACDRMGLRIVADRGQWLVEVHPGIEGIDAGGWEGWFSLEAWSVCLGQPRLFHDSRPTRQIRTGSRSSRTPGGSSPSSTFSGSTSTTSRTPARQNSLKPRSLA